jgi:hypothetical protein
MVTLRGHYTFTVKEWEDGHPWIAAEPAGNQIPGVEDGLGFDLERGTTLEEAKELARVMNFQISAVLLNV